MIISSLENPVIQRLARLDGAAARREQGLFLVEGRRAIDGFLAAGWRPAHLLVREDHAVPEGWPDTTRITARVAAKVSAASTPSGWVAVFPLPTHAAPDPAAGGLVLAGVADPGNLGTLIRTAAAFGVEAVVAAGGADPFGPKAVQASAGALAAVRVHRLDDPLALAGGAPLCALVPRGGTDLRALAPARRWIVVGGEADGVPERWIAAASERATLPMRAGVESLNAAVAGVIALWELVARPRA